MTKEEIMEAIKRHHKIVEDAGYHVVMTSLVGSQNYGLDNDESDIDTFSFILPSFEELARGEPPKAGIIFSDDGHCNFKDIRTAFDLLRKTSPNSVEYFISKYKYYNPVYAPILKEYLKDGCDSKLWYMIHCNHQHMYNAIIGMAIQLTKRNMPAGKRFSHALRLEDMADHFRIGSTAGIILDMTTARKDLALRAKRDPNPGIYDELCVEVAEGLKEYFSDVKVEWQKEIEETGLIYIKEFEETIFKKYLTVLMEEHK